MNITCWRDAVEAARPRQRGSACKQILRDDQWDMHCRLKHRTERRVHDVIASAACMIDALATATVRTTFETLDLI